MAILCGLLPPIGGLVGILGNALTEIVGKSKVERTVGITGQGRLVIPDHGFFPVLLYTLAMQITIAQGIFRYGISVICQCP